MGSNLMQKHIVSLDNVFLSYKMKNATIEKSVVFEGD